MQNSTRDDRPLCGQICAQSPHLLFFLHSQVLELQNTLDQLANRVDNVKQENSRLASENLVLGEYVRSLVQASEVFQAVNRAPSRESRTSSEATAGTKLGSVVRCTVRAAENVNAAVAAASLPEASGEAANSSSSSASSSLSPSSKPRL